MRIADAFPSKYLRPGDLVGHEPVVVIEDVQRVTTWVAGKKTDLIVVKFVGKDKGLVLNKTNARAITDLLGSDDTESWRGRSVRLYPTVTPFGDRTVPCIRVKAVGPRAVLTKTG